MHARAVSRAGRLPRVWLARGFLALTLTWMLALVMVPFLLAHETGVPGVRAASAGTYLVGSVICHQKPDRSFRLWGVQMPVCARCAGLYLGAVLGVLVAACGTSRRRGHVAARVASPVLRWMVLAAAVPTGVTVIGEVAGWLASAGGLRATAAVPLGAVMTWVAGLVIRGDLA